MEADLAGLTLEEEEDEILQIQTKEGTNGDGEFLQLVGCFLTASIVHFPAMRSTMAKLWHPIRGVQITDLGGKRGENPLQIPLIYSPLWVQVHDVPIGHSDSFYETRMEVGVETAEMGWDLSIRAQSRRAQLMTRVWLREEGMGYHIGEGSGNGRGNMENSLMEHDLKDEVIIGHSDSFCETRMEVGVETAELGWDLSIRAQSRRAQLMTSVWLREE
ncbi:hypothetical protein Godav_025136 [Gossypium davidsonii]|uniref:DUF4283 domain-containing protein n=1 Tax=Gossypium davidsonii TaxID=34287 RepID=A0A7J8TJM6_GOSDV|nr:hypothetical protein [Gossypium davidsonii]